jgi:hypothetical protein
MSRQYTNLPSHQGIKISFQFYQIDQYSSDSVSFVFNGKNIPYNVSSLGKPICGDNLVPDSVVKI